MSLQNIPVKTESAEACSIGSLRALLAEIAAGLQKLVQKGNASCIDINSLPFAPGEYEQLRAALGDGEVSARIEALGVSEIRETRYPGVWWVTHYNVEDDIIADMIEITDMPDILKSQPADVATGLVLLDEELTRLDGQADSEVRQ